MAAFGRGGLEGPVEGSVFFLPNEKALPAALNAEWLDSGTGGAGMS